MRVRIRARLTQKRPIVLNKIGQRNPELGQHVRDVANSANIRYVHATVRNTQVLTAAIPPHAGYAPRTTHELHIASVPLNAFGETSMA